jgi:single stranded DNA-binding protein
MSNVCNTCTLIGRLGDEPEIRAVGDKDVAKFRLAVERTFKKRGEDKPGVDWFTVEVWGTAVQFVEDYCFKGQLVAVCGDLRRDEPWEDRKGVKHESFTLHADSVKALQWKDDEKGAGTGKRSRDEDDDEDDRRGSSRRSSRRERDDDDDDAKEDDRPRRRR